MKVKYIGAKYGMPIMTPVGKKPTKRSTVHCVVNPGDEVELKDEEAISLVALDSINFALSEQCEKIEKASVKEPETVEEVKAGVSLEAPKRRAGRPRKLKS